MEVQAVECEVKELCEDRRIGLRNISIGKFERVLSNRGWCDVMELTFRNPFRSSSLSTTCITPMHRPRFVDTLKHVVTSKYRGMLIRKHCG